MTLLYRGPGARITNEVFEALLPCRQVYLISELWLVHTVRETTMDTALRSPTARVCSSTMSGASIAVAAAGTQVLDSPSTTVASAVIAIFTAAMAVKGWRVHRRPLGLWAFHYGEKVCLYQTRDRLEFGRVRRALLRALEHVHDSH